MKPYYQHAGITIYHGDCREILPQLQACDLCFTSPPYGYQRDYGAPIGDWAGLVVPAIQAMPQRGDMQLFVNLGLIYRDGELWEYWRPMLDAARSAGWRHFGWYVWDKGFGAPGDWNGRFAPAHEFIFHFNLAPRIVNKTDRCRQAGLNKGGSGLRRADGSMSGLSKPAPINEWKIPDSVLRIWPEQTRNGYQSGHPAVFPIELPAKIIAAMTQPGQVVGDPFAGSGTVLVAAKEANRQAWGIEIEEKYCEIAARRLSQEVFQF